MSQVGVKVRLVKSLMASDEDPTAVEAEAFSRALEVARQTHLPLAVHHASSSVPMDECPGKMSKGDIYTHCFTSRFHGAITLDKKTIHPAKNEP